MNTTTTSRNAAKVSIMKAGARTVAKTAANVVAETINRAMEAAASGFLQRMIAFNGEAARLAERRASHYREYFGELTCCQSPVDVGQAVNVDGGVELH